MPQSRGRLTRIAAMDADTVAPSGKLDIIGRCDLAQVFIQCATKIRQPLVVGRFKQDGKRI